MLELNAKLVSDLRARTGLPLMKCKKALTETTGSYESVDFWMNAAIEHLRKQGESAVDRMADRETPCGRIGLKVEDNWATIVKLGCQTDFVANSEEFKKLVNDCVAELEAKGADAHYDPLISDAVLKLGENIKLTNATRYRVENSTTIGYNHDGKIGVVVTGTGDAQKLKTVALHIASVPGHVYLERSDVPSELVDKEKEIINSLPDVQSKTEALRPRIVEGKLNKFYADRVLFEQVMLLDALNSKEKVSDYCKRNGIAITSFMKLFV